MMKWLFYTWLIGVSGVFLTGFYLAFRVGLTYTPLFRLRNFAVALASIGMLILLRLLGAMHYFGRTGSKVETYAWMLSITWLAYTWLRLVLHATGRGK